MFKQRYKNANDNIGVSETVRENILNQIENGNISTPKSLRVPYIRIAAATMSLMLVAGLSYFGFRIYTNNEYAKSKSKVQTSDGFNKNDYSDAYDKISEIFNNARNKSDSSGNAITEYSETTIGTKKGTKSKAIDIASSDYIKTNTQKKNIDEGDLVKTDGKVIYTVKDNSKIDVYRASGKDSHKSATVNTLPKGINSNEYRISEMYIYEDKLIVIGQIGAYLSYSCTTYENNRSDCEASTVISLYDAKDEENIKLIKTIKQDGISSATRISDSDLYVVTEKDINEDKINKDDIATFVPKCIVGENEFYVSKNNLYIPKSTENASYAIVNSYSLDTEKLTDSKAVLGGSADVYMDDTYLVVSNYCYGEEKKETQTDCTELFLFRIENGKITKKASKRVKGQLLNQFSMDMYEEHLRVVTTVNSFKTNGKSGYLESVEKTNSVYVLDNQLNITGAIEDLAKDESVYSVRFLGNIGYFVTYRTTDPLFAVDLKNPYHPKILSELKIEGFSSYLHPYNGNELLGLGYNEGETNALKLTMFDISNPTNVKDIVTEIVSDKGYDNAYSDATYNHKAFYFDDKNKQFGFSFCQEVYNDTTGVLTKETYFVIYKYKNKKFEIVKKIKLDGNLDIIRGTRIGNEFYIVTSEYYDNYEEKNTSLRVYDIEKYQFIKKAK